MRRVLSVFAPGFAASAALIAILLSGCATGRSGSVVLGWPEQQALLGALPAYGLNGRVAARVGEEGWQANARWRQRAATSEVELSGPFGAGSLLLRLTGEELQVVDSQGNILRGEQALEALTRQLGFAPPLAALRYWLLALPGPAGGDAAPQFAQDGTLSQLEQQGWLVRYEDYSAQVTAGGSVRLPSKLTATRGNNVRLRLVVDRWQLRTEREQ